MPRKTSTQWDFGELLVPNSPASTTPAPATGSPASQPSVTAAGAVAKRGVLTVTELTLSIKRTLEGGFGAVRVGGEISNYRLQSSGHAYFVLKDANAQLSCVRFRGQGGADRGLLRDGAQVILDGELTVYEPRGQYQLRVTGVELQGVGALQAAFERLKAKLGSEGLFEPGRKRPLPPFPRRVGLVTSPTGAAIRDVLHVLRRRFAGLEIVLVPVRVQGQGAAEEIAAAVALLNEWNTGQNVEPPTSNAERQNDGRSLSGVLRSACDAGLDVILVTRGGGSLEDLWAFNEEVVARAIAASTVPVVSAVGHEIDFTIADFVADFRAATPSAAAEILTQNYVASADFVAGAQLRLHQLLRQRLGWAHDEAAGFIRRLVRAHPRRRLESWAQLLDDLSATLARSARTQVRSRVLAQENVLRRLLAQQPGLVLARKRRELELLARRLPKALRAGLAANHTRLAALTARLRLLSPQNVLERGYSITTDSATGSVVRDPAALKTGQRLRTTLAAGVMDSVVVPLKTP